jgi:penicillin-binding protein 1B
MTRRSRTRKPKSSSARVLTKWGRFWRYTFYALIIVTLLMAIWTIYLDIQVRQKFEGKKWALPARVYAQPLELYQGLSLTPALFEQELKALGYSFNGDIRKPGNMVKKNNFISGVDYHIQSRGFVFWDKTETAQTFRLTIDENLVTALHDQAGADLPLIRMEPQEIGGFYPANKEDRLLVKLEEIPPLLGETLIAVEDKHFLEHHGVSPMAILRAAWVNVSHGGVRQGGSTITQQLVKNFYLTNKQSILQRKIPEAIMAVLLEIHYSKSEILETYINEVFLGQSGDREINGFALGAQHYFRRPLTELNLQQIAFLVGVVKGASYYNPWKHPERAKERRNVVLAVMFKEKLIDETQFKAAQAAPLGIVSESAISMTTYPAFMDLVKRQLKEDYQEKDLRSEGLRIFTTLSPALQRQAEATVVARIQQMESRAKQKNTQVGFIVTSVGSGEILAMVSDKNPRFDGYNRALDAKRQMGSLMKPFVYLAALEIPQAYNLMTTISDDPVSYKSGGKLWAPQNYDKMSHGQLPLYQALANSYNQSTARLGMTLGLSKVIKTVKRAGYPGDVEELPSILLGAKEMTPFEVASVYHTIAAEGVYTPLHAIREVLTAEGQPLKRYPLELEQRFSAESIFQLQFALQQVMQTGTGRSAITQLPTDLIVAGKTGTTNDQRDSWFAGFSGEHLAVVWMGNDDNTVTPFSGASGALQLWTDFMKKIPTRSLSQDAPPGVVFDWLDTASGKLGAENCMGSVWIPIVEEFKPLQNAECIIRPENKNWLQRIFN